MSVYVVIAQTCADCNRMAVAVFDHAPTNQEIDRVRDSAGGGCCIFAHIAEAQVNGEPVALEQRKD